VSTRKKKLIDAVNAPRARKGPLRQRQRLIDACNSALHIFGPSRTTVEKVVAIAKMSPGIVRFYFDSKSAMLVASLQFLAAEFEEQVLVPVAKLKSRPVAALQLMVDLYLDPDIASSRKVSVWYAFWGEASSRQEYYDICGQKDESFAALVRELIESLITETAQPHLDPDGVALGLIGVLEILWQDFAFQTERDIDRAAAKRRCMAYLRSVFPGKFDSPSDSVHAPDARGIRFAGWAYGNSRIFAMERDSLFHGAWVVAGHESQIPRAGEFLTVEVGTERVLVVRDHFGTVHALRNSCPELPHALVLNRKGRFEGTIECKRHGLDFSLDGRGSNGSRMDLERLGYRSVGGLMFVRSPKQAHVTDAAELPAAWLDTQLPQGLMLLESPLEFPVAADWKLVVEQWLESASFDPAADFASDSVGWDAAILGQPNWSSARYARLVDCVADPVWRRHFILPNHLLETRPDGVSVLQALPIAPGRSLLRRLDYSVLPPDNSARAAQYLARRVDSYARRGTLDMVESLQTGMVEFGYDVTSGGPVPAAVSWFRRELAARVPALALDRSPTHSG
jgi:TetR/AcrR family transcriptional repressor of bet genes